ncbi:hypothetical protein I3843_04G094300 [Carya illinoinensis]|nr:hypothetical protein I3843_04G094300 [Carya illinoinensis]
MFFFLLSQFFLFFLTFDKPLCRQTNARSSLSRWQTMELSHNLNESRDDSGFQSPTMMLHFLHRHHCSSPFSKHLLG